MMSAGAKIKALRESQGLSIYRLEQITGINRAFISMVERETRTPSPDFLAKVAPVIGGDADELQALVDASKVGEAGLERIARHVAPMRHPQEGEAPWRPLSEAARPMVELANWGAVGCGQGLELAQPAMELVPADLAAGSDGWVWARGRSMDAAGIVEGSQVFVRAVRRGEPKDGQVVLAHVPGEGAVVKRFKKSGSAGWLMSETLVVPAPTPIPVAQGVAIQGIVLRVQPPRLEF